jgi:hypothetical protein
MSAWVQHAKLASWNLTHMGGLLTLKASSSW